MSLNVSGGKVGWSTPSFSAKGPVTIGTLWCPDWFGGSTLMWIAYKADNFQCHSQYSETNNMWSEAIHASMGYGDVSNPPKWSWFVLTASSPSAVPRMHYGAYAETGDLTWIHADCDGSWPSRADSVDFNIGDPFGGTSRGNFAVSVGYEFGMTDAEVESIFERSSSQLLAAGPDLMFHWPEADGVAWDDQAGDAILLSARVSGPWAPSADPPGFDFALAPPRTGQPKIWNGTQWVNHPLKVWNGSAWVEHPVKGHDGTDWVLSK